ncbi:hypothetical protein [uncultured Methanobrevibacter sp.]|uniref:hypothetical protein n=1 Tax=uncultured Methanobrevibacter sp. TaxID=253161 RepID=UPI0025E34D93|nr:hypothetical protein [uncultured Methanobrevibacter sp.]
MLDGQSKRFVGQTLTFNIIGVMYNKIMDNMGIAQLNINLMLVSTLLLPFSNGAAISNKIIINDNPDEANDLFH